MAEYLIAHEDDPVPVEYTRAAVPTVPGADWIFEGRRYREVGRSRNAAGVTITIRRADADPTLGLYFSDAEA